MMSPAVDLALASRPRIRNIEGTKLKKVEHHAISSIFEAPEKWSIIPAKYILVRWCEESAGLQKRRARREETVRYIYPSGLRKGRWYRQLPVLHVLIYQEENIASFATRISLRDRNWLIDRSGPRIDFGTLFAAKPEILQISGQGFFPPLYPYQK